MILRLLSKKIHPDPVGRAYVLRVTGGMATILKTIAKTFAILKLIAEVAWSTM